MSADRYIAVCHPIDAATVRTPFIAKVSRQILYRFTWRFYYANDFYLLNNGPTQALPVLYQIVT